MKGSSMRTMEDLIEKLREKAVGTCYAAIIVGFMDGRGTKLVTAESPNPLAELKAVVTEGGLPVGVARLTRTGAEMNFTADPFQEFANESWVTAYLDHFAAGFTKVLEAQFGGKILHIQPANFPYNP